MINSTSKLIENINFSLKQNLYDNKKKINNLNSIWEEMKIKLYPIPKEFDFNGINNMMNNNLMIDSKEYMEDAYKYYRNKKVPMPYDLYIVSNDEYDEDELNRCKEFDVNYNYTRNFPKEIYKLEKVDYSKFNDFDDTDEWKKYLKRL